MEFFLEIYSEEMPAMMQLDAQNQLETLLKKFFENNTYESIEAFITPQRLVGYVRGLSATTKEISEIIRGPKVNISADIVDRFCHAQKVERNALIEKDGHFYVEKKSPSVATKEKMMYLMSFILNAFQWPKTMRWPQSSIKWVRPIRSVMLILDREPLIFNIPELGMNTKSETIGHRFLNPSIIAPKTFDEYVRLLKEHDVILSHTDRQKIIRDNLQGALLDEDLVVENAGLTEYPIVRRGVIDDAFMNLPKEVLKTVMKKHQKYFFFESQPHFCAVCNIKEDTVMKGYERVLRARLNDAQFFYNTDVKVPLKGHDLSKIIFYKGLGTIDDKINRLLNMTKDVKELATIRLCKKDLLTQMVYEFPELQGIMGEIYARAQKQPEDVCLAIADHVSLQPKTVLGAKVALLDRLDSLVGLIGMGVKISGSKDPYGLRRHALTIIRIYEQFKEFDALETLIMKVLKQFPKLPSNTAEIVQEFIYSRFKSYYPDEAEYIQIALQRYPLHALHPASLKIKAFLNTSEGEIFLKAYKRLLGLLKVTKKTGEILTSHPSEVFLHHKIHSEMTLDDLKEIGQNLDVFFNEVTINEGAAHMIQSRQNLLFLLNQKISQIGDFSLAV